MRENPMRCYLIVAAVVLVASSLGLPAFGQGRVASGTGNQAFNVGGGGQGPSGAGDIGSVGQQDTNARYMRDNRQGAFVGADAGDTSFVGAASAGTSQARNVRRGGGGRTNVNQGGGRGRQRNEVRVVLQLGFTPPKPASIAPRRAPAQVASRLAGRMERSSWIQNRSPLKVQIDEGIATLQGVVSTEHDRVLAERLVLLEPGIRTVTNELQIEPVAPATQEAPSLLKP